jgi:diguanylate cyclase (GGDEF)-like protein
MGRAGDRRDGDSLSPDVITQLLAFVERTSDWVGVVDEQGRVLYVNEAARKRLGVGDGTELTTADIFPPEAFVLYYEEIRPTLLRTGIWEGELPVVTGSGAAVPMAVTVVASVGPGGEVNGVVTTGREVEPPSTAEATPTVAYDQLTGLPGRTAVENGIRVALTRAARDGHRIAVFLADVDGMREINDSFGHAVGDDVLREFARALSRCAGADDALARFGDDEFVLLVDRLDGADGASRYAERLRDSACRVPIEMGTDVLAVTASFGLAVGEPGDDPSELMQRAHAAVQRAKATGRAKVVAFDEASEMSFTALADEFALAVSHGLIHPYVQPVIDLHRGVAVGFQGLARWDHPRRGLLDADQFVDLVANAPTLAVVDLAVLRRTAAAAARTARTGTQLRAYGHLCRRALGDANLTRYVTEISEDCKLTPSDLYVEIAQELVARPSRAVESAMLDLREAGVRMVLSGVDGPFEVDRIVNYRFDELRLARRLVRDAGRDQARRRVAQESVEAARALGLAVTAVGIETDAERVDMREIGCDYGQGNLFGSAQPAGAIR